MTKKYNKSMFEKIKKNLDSSKGTSGFQDMLRLNEGNNYLLRLVPNVDDIDNTFYHYYNFGWESKATGQYVSAVSPITIGERCPIDEARRKLYQGNDADKALAQVLRRTEQWLVNAYVIENPTDDSTVGNVKILRYGKQLEKIITEAISGDDADDFGPAIFDLSEDGCNFRVKVETQAGFKNYTASRFLKNSAIPGMTESKMNDIYGGIHKLEDVFQIKSYDELQEMLEVHLFNNTAQSAPPVKDEINYEVSEPVKPKATKKSKPAPVVEDKSDSDSLDADIDDLLDGIDL